jgi:hypothetical protein
LATPWGPPALRRCLTVLAAIYLVAVGLDATGTGIPDRLLPMPLRFFVQEAALFPHAAPEEVEWRVEGWSCDEQRFAEIDVRSFFPIRRDDKESRFYRAMFFHHRERTVMKALDAFITRAQNGAHPDQRIGGVVLLSLRVPIPRLGSNEPRYRWKPISDFPHVERRYWYVTSADDRSRRCAETP